jgi:predicted AlkP superfamily phosphohydrolase/phosphomutase
LDEAPDASEQCGKPRRHLPSARVEEVGTLTSEDHRRERRLGPRIVLAAIVGIQVGCGGARRATRPVTNQVVILGFDGADPTLAQKWMDEGKLPNLARLARTGTFVPLGTTNPPESPVAWASFATGLNPGGTGIFDFLKRDPKTYLPELALVKAKPPEFAFGLIPLRGPQITNERHGTPFYESVADAGFKSTILRAPLEFPPTPVPGGKLWSGLSVPDARGTWGTFFYFSTDLTPWDVGDTEFGGRLVRLALKGETAKASIDGPVDPAAKTYRRVSVPVQFTVAPDANTVTIHLDEHSETVQDRHWSPWFHVAFPITPFLSIHSICRFYVLEVYPDVRLYMSPLNFDPSAPAVPITYPKSYSAQLARRFGPFKTIGWWHDTWGLNEEKIGEGVFLDDLFQTMGKLQDITLWELKQDPPSLMVSIFTSTDSVSHMFFRLIDPQHPRYDPVLARKYGDAILSVYERMDQVVGKVLSEMKPGATLIIVSDHGFHTWRWGFNTNTWLVENGFMALKNPNAKEKSYNLAELFGHGSFFPNVDWSHTKAYSLGLGQIYVNLKGREKYGIVEPGPQENELVEDIRQKLLAYRDPDTHEPVLEHVYLGTQIFHGPYMADAPDLQLNFRPGYRTSWQTALGAIPDGIVVANMMKWSGDHCSSDPSDTKGIFFSNRKLLTPDPSITDIAPTVLNLFHIRPSAKLDGKILKFGPANGS